MQDLSNLECGEILWNRNVLLYMSTEIYSKQSCQIKMVCRNLETIWLVIWFFSLVKNIVCGLWLVIRCFSLVKKMVSVFPPFGAASQSGNIHNFRCFPWIDHGFKVCRRCFSRTIYRRPLKWKHKKENSTECCFGISDAEERVKTYGRNSPKGAECIHYVLWWPVLNGIERRRIQHFCQKP